MKFREDMLLRVMDAAGIDVGHRDAFVAFAADYDHDDNGYLKKAELEDAACCMERSQRCLEKRQKNHPKRHLLRNATCRRS